MAALDRSTGEGRETQANAPEVKRLRLASVGVITILFMALSGSAPITAMTGNVPIAVGYGNGEYAPGGYIIALIVLVFFAIGYAAMSRHVTATGSFYGYISHGLGQTWGMLSGLLATVAYVVFEASLIGIFGYFAETTIHTFGGPNISWVIYGLIGIVIVAILGYLAVQISGRVLAIFLITEVAILLILGLSVLFHGGGPDGLVPGALNPIKGFSAVASDPKLGIVGSAAIGLFFAFWSWVGFETAAVYGEESKDPKKSVPRAIMMAVIAVGIIYVFVSWMTIAGNGPAQAIALSRSSNPFQLFFGITQSFVGVWAKDIYLVLIITGSFACALAFHNTASRYIYALGREAPGAKLRNFFGATHDKHKSPHVASLLQSAVTLIITLGFFWLQKPSASAPNVGYDYLYALMAILGTLLVLICQVLVSLSVIAYFHIRKEHPETANWWRTLLAPAIATVGMAYVVYILITNLSFAAGAAASSPVFAAIPWIAVAVAVCALVFAISLRRWAPDRYKLMGRTVLGDAHERTDGNMQ